jgi:hypothetical protein
MITTATEMAKKVATPPRRRESAFLKLASHRPHLLRQHGHSRSSEDPGSAESSGHGAEQVKASCRLLILGTSNTGKSQVLARFLHQARLRSSHCHNLSVQPFNERYLPTVDTFHRRSYLWRRELYHLDILDTGGRDPFPAARRVMLTTGRICFDNRT